MLEFRLLGTPIVTYNGQLLDIRRRATRALLYYLAATGQPIGRERLATFLWSDIPEDESRARLRDLLGKVRQALPESSLLNTTNQRVSLVFDEISVDVLNFKKLYAQINRITWPLSPNIAIPTATYIKMVEMVELWNTPGFIAGVDVYVSRAFEDWIINTGHELEREYLDIIQRLYRHECAVGNLRLGIHWLVKALEHDSLHTEINQLLIKTYLKEGQRSEAQKQFEYLQQLWGRDDAELPKAIEALRDEVFGQVEEHPPQEEQGWPVHPSFNVPYIGQEQIFNQVDSLYNRGGVIILYGEAGAGKTRLAQEVYKRISPRPRLLLTACYAHKTDIPFHPWSELLRKYVTPDEWQQLDSFEASMLSIIVPELASWRKDLQPVPDLVTARVRQTLFDAIDQALQLISRDRPIMLFLDDVHWADESSFELIIHLLNRSFFRQTNHIFLMASRVEERNPGSTQFLQTSPRRQLEQVYLEHLNPVQTAELAFQVLRIEPPQEFVERLAKETGGNPYFILETLQGILDSPIEISSQDVASFPISDSVYKVILYRLRRLSTDARKVLEIAALLGNHFDVAIAERVSGYSTEMFIHAIDELQAAYLITEVHDSKTIQYAFVHENIRETLMQDLPPLQAKLLHQHVANALTDAAQGKSEEIASNLAQHYEAAEEFSLAFDYWVESASHAYHMTSIKETLQAFRCARHLISIEKKLTDKQIYELYTTWSDIAFNLDDPAEIEHLNLELLTIGEERNSDLLIGAALDGLSDACFTSNQFEDGLGFVLQAESYLERAGNLYELLCDKMHHGVFLYMLGKMPEACEILYQVFEQIPENDSPKFATLKGTLHYQLGIVETLMGYPTKGLDFLEHGIQLTQKKTTLIEFYTAMGLAYYLKGDFRAGYDSASKAIEMGEQIEYRRMLGYAYAYCALNAHYLCILDEAWHLAEKALEIGQKYGHHEISALAYRTMGNVYLRLEDYPSAMEHFQNGLQVAGEHFVALELMTLLGHTLTAVGQVEEGLDYITKSHQIATQLHLGSISVYAHSMLLTTKAHHQGVDSAFLEEIELALVDAKSRSMNRAVMILSTPFIRVSQRPGDYAKHLNDVLDSAARLPDPLFETRILQYLIKFKKEHDLPWHEEIERMKTVLAKLAPHAAGMPFENAWQRYVESMLAGQTA